MTNYTVLLKGGERKHVKNVDYVYLNENIIRFLDNKDSEIRTFYLSNILTVNRIRVKLEGKL